MQNTIKESIYYFKEWHLQVNMYKLATESEKYYHSRLILYWPRHSETELLGNCQAYQHHYSDERSHRGQCEAVQSTQ